MAVAALDLDLTNEDGKQKKELLQNYQELDKKVESILNKIRIRKNKSSKNDRQAL